MLAAIKFRFNFNAANEFLKIRSTIQKKRFQTSTIAKSVILNKYQTKNVFLNSYIKISYLNQYRNLLETTRVKINSSFDDTLDYIEKLIKEKFDLEKKLSIVDINDVENKQDQTKRLSYLNEVFIHFEKMSKCINDIRELNEMAKEIDKSDEKMKKLIQEDYNDLNNNLLQYKIGLIDLIVPDEAEDIENAILELNAGVGGAESRLFLTELFEMYNKFSLNQGKFILILM
jgi:hypothetical protein